MLERHYCNRYSYCRQQHYYNRRSYCRKQLPHQRTQATEEIRSDGRKQRSSKHQNDMADVVESNSVGPGN
ncbi:hypothetical protein BHM03_00063093 [Ensete ventricosum]|nr:hypothetical protein BHM03_00063093 [Ensete ventricosum]